MPRRPKPRAKPKAKPKQKAKPKARARVNPNAQFNPVTTLTPQTTLSGRPAPTQPARPALPSPTFDSSYWNEVASAQTGYGIDQARIGLDRDRLGYDTGFGANGLVDVRNPYNQALMLQRGWEQSQSGINNSMAAQGQLYSGARRRSLSEDTFNYNRNRTNLQTSAQRGYQDLTLEEQSALARRNAALYGAKAGQTQRWEDDEDDYYARYG